MASHLSSYAGQSVISYLTSAFTDKSLTLFREIYWHFSNFSSGGNDGLPINLRNNFTEAFAKGTGDVS